MACMVAGWSRPATGCAAGGSGADAGMPGRASGSARSAKARRWSANISRYLRSSASCTCSTGGRAPSGRPSTAPGAGPPCCSSHDAGRAGGAGGLACGRGAAEAAARRRHATPQWHRTWSVSAGRDLTRNSWAASRCSRSCCARVSRQACTRRVHTRCSCCWASLHVRARLRPLRARAQTNRPRLAPALLTRAGDARQGCVPCKVLALSPAAGERPAYFQGFPRGRARPTC